MATHYYTLTWDQLHRDARALAWKLLPRFRDGTLGGIVGVSRGGLVPATILARELDCRLVESMSVVAYPHGAEQPLPPRLIKPAAAAGDGQGFLVVDDLADTGATLALVRNALPRAYFACLYVKPAGRGAVDDFVTELSQDTWILFPWDTAPQFAQPVALT